MNWIHEKRVVVVDYYILMFLILFISVLSNIEVIATVFVFYASQW